MVINYNGEDVFHLTGKGGSGAKAWIFADSGGNILDRAAGNALCENLKLNPPENTAYIILNADNRYGKIVIKNALIKDQINELMMESQLKYDDRIRNTWFGGKYDYTLSWIDGYYIDKNDEGKAKQYTGWKCTEFIEISPYATITTYTDATGGTTYNAYYDSNKEFIEPFNNHNAELSIPSNAKYIRLSCRQTETNAVSLDLFNGITPIIGCFVEQNGVWI